MIAWDVTDVAGSIVVAAFHETGDILVSGE